MTIVSLAVDKTATDPTSIRKVQPMHDVHNPLLHSHHHHLFSSDVLSSLMWAWMDYKLHTERKPTNIG